MRLRDVSIAALLADQFTKFLVLHHLELGRSVTVIPGYLYFTHIQNPGAAFGFMANTPAWARVPFFLIITLGAGVVVYAFQRFIPKEKVLQRFALGLIWGGAMGNFVDRVVYRQVVDFIDVRFHQHQWFPYIFNVADSCITVGLALLILTYWRERPPQRSR
ncbi:MAG TPA: signal peptidase II [bacterium]|nr:signal peptidase II [bacterium]